MSEQQDTTTTLRVKEFIAEKHPDANISIHPVEGGYSRNRRAIVDIGDESVFAKEVDIELLPDEGIAELGWLNKDCEVINELSKQGIDIAPEWAELHLNGHLLLMPSYKKEDGWEWTLPENTTTRAKYVQAVIDATKKLETTKLPEELTEKLHLQPFFRDEIAEYEGIAPLFTDTELRSRLIDRYTKLQERGGHLRAINAQMIETLRNDDSLRHLQEQTARLAELPNNCLNHCDVRSDNIAYNTRTGEVKFVDWNWTSYAPAKFGSTEFLLDLARRGVDVSPWRSDMCEELLAALVGYYMIRGLLPPLTPGNTLREMQAETAAVANYLYQQSVE